MKKRCLVINLGWEQEPLLERLAAREDIELYGIHYDENYFQGANWKDILICDLRDLPRILEFAEKVKPQAVISDQCDYSYFAQAVIAEKYNLPGPRVAEAQRATNKYLQRTLTQKGGFPVPRFFLCRNLEEAREAARTIGFPLIVKPVDNRGSFGVNRVEGEEDLADSFYEALAHSHSREVLVEEFVEGVHITVDGYVFQEGGVKSLALASKKMLGGRRQVAMEIIYPGELPESIYHKAWELNEKINRFLGFRFGFIHSEYMVRGHEVFLIETANRGGGVYTSEIIVPEVSGCNLVEEYIRDALGEGKSRAPEKIERHRVMLKFFRLSEGTIEKIEGIEKINGDERVLKFRLLVKPGEEIKAITTDANRHGFIILKAEDLKKASEEVLSRLKITYSEFKHG